MSSYPLDRFALPAMATAAGFYQYSTFLRAVGKSREKFCVPIPDTTGPPEFNRTNRATMNTLEFYPLTLGSLWLGSVFFHPVPSSLLYLGYLAGRQRYFHAYIEEADKRIPPFYMCMRFLRVMLLVAVVGVGHKLLRFYGGVDLYEILHERLPALKCD